VIRDCKTEFEENGISQTTLTDLEKVSLIPLSSVCFSSRMRLASMVCISCVDTICHLFLVAEKGHLFRRLPASSGRSEKRAMAMAELSGQMRGLRIAEFFTLTYRLLYVA